MIERYDNGEVIHSGEFDSVADCLEDAIKKEISLWRANLSYANLSYANLSYANLRSANLRYADLRYANLSSANLSSADLRSADFCYSYGGNHRHNCAKIGDYMLVIVDDICWGGCTKKTVQEWLDFDGKEESESDRKYLETVTKPFIRMVMEQRK